MAQKIERSSPLKLWLLFLASAAVTIALFFFPAYVIRPFAYQAPRALWWAMAIRQWAPLATIFTGLLCLTLVLMLWRTVGIWRKILLVTAMLPVCFSAVMARMNYFEWMFHPVDEVRVESAAQRKLDAGEMVMTVAFSGDARAYPISEMAYHHIVNDVVGGVPIAVTY